MEMSTMKLEEIASVMKEYGAAIRGDWGSIDGRCEQSSIQTFADAILEPGKYEAATLRDQAGICPVGSGHWTDHCGEDCEATK